MTPLTPLTIIAIFDNLQQSERAFQALVANGSDPEEIHIGVEKVDATPQAGEAAAPEGRRRLRAAILGSFATGGAIGAFLGGIGAHLTLDLGPMVLVGPVSGLIGATLGMCGGWFVTAMAEGAAASAQNQSAEEGSLLGEVVLTVHTRSNVAARVEELLRREGAREIERIGTETPALVTA
jgi:hypothetical protein